MFAPTYLSETDRNRLVTINQTLMTGLDPDTRDKLLKERDEITAKQKNMGDCTIEELHDLRQQLFNHYQKHAAIGSSQTQTIASYIRQVEQREWLINNKRVKEPEKTVVEETKPKTVSTKNSTTDWVIDID